MFRCRRKFADVVSFQIVDFYIEDLLFGVLEGRGDPVDCLACEAYLQRIASGASLEKAALEGEALALGDISEAKELMILARDEDDVVCSG